MILFDEKVEYERQNPGQDDTTADPQPQSISPTGPLSSRPSSAPPSLTAGLLRYYLALDDERNRRLSKRIHPHPHVTSDSKPPLSESEKPAAMIVMDPPLYESSGHAIARSAPSELASEASSSKNWSPPSSSRQASSHSRHATSISAAQPPLRDNSHSLNRLPISPTHHLIAATPYSHAGNYNLSVYREQSGITGNYILNTDIELVDPAITPQSSKSPNTNTLLHNLGADPYIWLETKGGSIDARVSMVGSRKGLLKCSVVATTHNGDVKLALLERPVDPDLNLHIHASSLQGGNVQASLPENFAGTLRIITPTSMIPFTSYSYFSPKISTSSQLILISETVSDNLRHAEYFFGSPEAAANYFAQQPTAGSGQTYLGADTMVLEARNGKVMVYAHREFMCDGWLTSCRKMLGRWLGFGRS